MKFGDPIYLWNDDFWTQMKMTTYNKKFERTKIEITCILSTLFSHSDNKFRPPPFHRKPYSVVDYTLI